MMKVSPFEGEVWRNEFFVVTREGGGRVVRLRRTDVPITEGALQEIEGVFERLFPPILRRRFAMLMDSRDAPMSNDPALEARVRDVGLRLFNGFAERAVLVQSAAGKLQVSRMNRTHGGRPPVFYSEADAMEYLLGSMPPPSRRW